MLFRLIYDDVLAQAAYVIGCQRTGEAIVFDPERDVDRYVALAKKEGMRIVAAAETHIHADFLSGVRQLAEMPGVRAHVSGEGGADWNSRWLNSRSSGGAYDAVTLKHGDTFRVGGIHVRAIHTPGHTPEHMCYLITDEGGGAAEPMGIISGDFVFVGDLGRPDLLETAAGVAGTKEAGARDLFASVAEFVKLPEYLQVWPAHGAGSACGKALGAVPQTTVGYERRFNPSIRAAAEGQDVFVKRILAGQPEPPTYFARMKRENRDGPAVLAGLPRPAAMSVEEAAQGGHTVIDTRAWPAFRAGHIPGSIFAPLDSMFINVTGGYVEPGESIVLVAPADRVELAVRLLLRIGLDRVVGVAEPGAVDQWATGAGSRAAEVTVHSAAERLGRPDAFFLDVRSEGEFAEGHAPGAVNISYTRLSAALARLPRDREIVVNCKAGGRSARACAYLQRKGFRAVNVEGGWMAWERAGLARE